MRVDGREGVVRELEVRLFEQRGGVYDGVGRVGEDSVVCGRVVREELEAVADVHADVRERDFLGPMA
jgi:hypothetical protein